MLVYVYIEVEVEVEVEVGTHVHVPTQCLTFRPRDAFTFILSLSSYVSPRPSSQQY